MRKTLSAMAVVAWLMAGPSFAQAQRTVLVLEGDVTRELGPDAASWIASHADQVIGLKVRIDPTPNAAPGAAYQVFGEPSQTRITVSSVNRETDTGLEINADAVWSHGVWRLDGFYVPKFAGMGQGILAFYLEPVDEAVVRLSPARRLTVRTEAIPAESGADSGAPSE
jgi:hypothetical protein